MKSIYFKILSAGEIENIIATGSKDELMEMYFLYDNKIRDLQLANDEKSRLLELTTDMTSQVSLEGVFNNIKINRPEILGGFTLEELKGAPAFELIHKDDLARVKKIFENTISHGQVEKVEYRAKRKDGTYQWVETFGRPKYSADHKLEYIILSTRDITDRKTAEEILRKSEKKFKETVDLLPHCYFEFKKENEISFVNKKGFQVFGYDENDITKGLNIFQMLDEQEVSKVSSYMHRFYTGEDVPSLETTGKRKSGEKFPIRISASQIIENGQVVGARGLVLDITDQKKREALIRQSEQRFREIIESSINGYFEVDLKGNMTYFNESLRELLGWPAEELLGLNYKFYMDKKNAGKIRNTFNHVYVTKRPVKAINWNLLALVDGKPKKIDVEASVMPIFDPYDKDEVIGFRGFVNDVTAQQEAQRNLLRSQEEILSIFNNSTEYMYSLAADGKFIMVNPNTLRILGQREAEVIGHYFYEFISPKYREEVKKYYYEHLIKGSQRVPMKEFPVINEKGEEVWVEQNVNPIFDGTRIVKYQAYGRDITERKIAETQKALFEKEKELFYKALKENEEKFRKIALNVSDVIMYFSKDRKITFMSPSAEAMTGYTVDELFEMKFSGFLAPESLNAIKNLYRAKGPEAKLPLKLIKKDGSEVWAEFKINQSYDDNNTWDGYVAVARDITTEVELKNQLKEIALRDDLTKLPKRNLFNEIFNNAVAKAQRAKKEGKRYIISILHTDINDFKQINDKGGHNYGDEVLMTTAQILHDNIRDTDIVARVGGDEFWLLLLEADSAAARKAESLVDELYKHNITVSIGVITVDLTELELNNPQELLKNLIHKADNAMYTSKYKGDSQVKLNYYKEIETEQGVKSIKFAVDQSHISYYGEELPPQNKWIKRVIHKTRRIYQHWKLFRRNIWQEIKN